MARKRKHDAPHRLDEAARAAWLYYVAENNQDEIAEKMGISRQSAQRLVALAMRKGLIRFRLDHPIAHCLELAEMLKARYGLSYCEVTLTDPSSDDPALGIAPVAAAEMERLLTSATPVVMALGTGREIRTAVEELPSMSCPQHKVVSLVGNLAPDGSASFYDVIMRIGDTINAPHYPMAVPVIATSEAERAILSEQKPIRSNIELAQAADVAFVGVGEMDDTPPLLTDGFITRPELEALQSAGAAGEIIGWIFDAQGQLMAHKINQRVASVPMVQPPRQPVVGVARGQKKLRAIRAALSGNWLTGLITDEFTARALCDSSAK